MVAIGILGIGMLIVAAAFPVAIDQSRQAMELYTSKMVFDEAVNQLKTQVTWVELEQYLAPTSSAKRLDGTGNICLIDNSTYARPLSDKTYDHDDNSSTPNIPIVTFSSDTTYGWLAAVQKIADRCYKFWIFVVREPQGVLNSSGNSIFDFVRYNDNLTVLSASDNTSFYLPVTNNERPQRGMQLLGYDGNLYTVQDLADNGTQYYNIRLDRATTPLTSLQASYIRGGVTRKTSVVAVYQTVISY